jgi:hypothetical protein
MSDTPTILLVPIRLDAWYLGASQQPIYPLANFARRQYSQVNPNWPNLSSELLVQPPDGAQNLYTDSFPAPQVSGLQLHWALPDALTVGYTEQGRAKFPAVPNRWLITRRSDGQATAQWVVESDYLHLAEPDAALGTLKPRNAITFPVTPPTTGDVRPSCRYMGRAVPFATWKTDDSGEYLPEQSPFPLTAVGYGDPIFAAYYPNCFSVFGFADTEVAAGAESVYDVLGWYQDPDSPTAPDCLRRFAGLTDPCAALQAEFHWTLQNRPASFPQLTVCYARLRVDPGKVASGLPAKQLSLAVGNTGTEALSAYLTRQIDSDNRGILEEQLEALSLSASLRGTELDLGARFSEARHQKGFRAAGGGTLWAVEQRGTATTKTAASRQASHEEITLPPELAALLNELNRVQQACDETRNEIVAAQRRLFGEWWKYMYVKYTDSNSLPPIDPCDQYPATACIQKFIQHTSMVFLNERSTSLAALTASLAAAQAALDQALAAANLGAELQAAKVELFRVERPAPRYWQARDPVVLIAGAAAVSTPRHGEDAAATPSGLPCTPFLLNQTDGDAPQNRGVLPRYFNQILDKVQELLESNPTQPFLGYQHQTEPPWHPILLDWEAHLWPNLSETQPWPNPEPIFKAFGSDFITASYSLPENAGDLQLTAKLEPGSAAENTYYGRCILTPHASRQTRYNLERYLLDVTLLDCWPGGIESNEIKTFGPRLATWYETVLGHNPSSPAPPQTSGADYERDFAVWCGEQHPFRQEGNGQLVDGHCAAQYPGKPIAGGKFFKDSTAAEQAQDPVYTAIRALGQLPGLQILSQSLGGFDDALLGRFRELQIPIEEPNEDINSSDTRFTSAVRDLVGGQNRSEPRDAAYFLPIRSGLMKLAGLTLVDTFGQQLAFEENELSELSVAETLTAAGHAGYVHLPPRLTQPARLELRWLAADHGDMEMNSHPATTPICGWLVPNNLDNSLMVYDGAGAALGSIQQTAAWEPAPGAGPRMVAEQIPNPHLRKLVAALHAAPGAGQEACRQQFLANLLTALDTGLENIDPLSFAQHEALALLMGRPIAVVRASVALRLAGLAAVNENWCVFEHDLDTLFGSPGSSTSENCDCDDVKADDYADCRTSNSFTNVQFPVRIGEYEQLDDGVIGYWIEDGTGYGNGTFYAPQSADNPDPQIQTHAKAPLNLLLAPGDPPLLLTLLIDPRGKVHATSGIVPAKVLEVPPDQYAQTLKKIAVTFLTAPVLTDGDPVHLPLPAEAGYQWSWLTRPDGATWRESFEIAATSTQPVSGATPKLIEGWLKLRPRKA